MTKLNRKESLPSSLRNTKHVCRYVCGKDDKNRRGVRSGVGGWERCAVGSGGSFPWCGFQVGLPEVYLREALGRRQESRQTGNHVSNNSCSHMSTLASIFSQFILRNEELSHFPIGNYCIPQSRCWQSDSSNQGKSTELLFLQNLQRAVALKKMVNR